LENANIVDYDPRSNGAKDYLSFAEEFLGRMHMVGKEAGV
jgi:hypothetical protein